MSDLRPIGRVESPLTDPAAAPKQGFEGGPEAWLVFEAGGGRRPRRASPPATASSSSPGSTARTASVLRVHPRDDPANPERGVFSTRSADRPNPIGLHPVEVLAVEGTRVRVSDLEAVDGTPILDVKPVL